MSRPLSALMVVTSGTHDDGCPAQLSAGVGRPHTCGFPAVTAMILPSRTATPPRPKGPNGPRYEGNPVAKGVWRPVRTSAEETWAVSPAGMHADAVKHA